MPTDFSGPGPIGEYEHAHLRRDGTPRADRQPLEDGDDHPWSDFHSEYDAPAKDDGTASRDVFAQESLREGLGNLMQFLTNAETYLESSTTDIWRRPEDVKQDCRAALEQVRAAQLRLQGILGRVE